MAPKSAVKAVRGMRDLLPAEFGPWYFAEGLAREVATRFGYQEIRTPILEPIEIAERGAGESSDIVRKEMYRFQDLGDRWVVLRPEGTAPAVRAYFEGGLNQAAQPARLFMLAPMFRYDRPGKGRYRQHQQFSLEAIGDASPALDAEVIEVAHTWYVELGLKQISLHINSIGDPKCRPAYRDALLAYFRPLRDRLSADSQRRLEQNPLRILDSKEDAALREGAPRIADYLCAECRMAFAAVQDLLDSAGIEYQLDPYLVRGLDYYTRTTFEFRHESLGGAQNAIGGGGRYDGLAAELGYAETPGVGFGLGVDRTLEVLAAEGIQVESPPAAELLVLPADPELEAAAAAIARKAREALPTAVDYSDRSLRAKMRAAGKSGARWAAIFNAAEAARRVVQLRDLASGDQREVGWDDLPRAIGE
ncbi:MAG TPA: histidine--tRNA ligase [Candidatus Dormibacteraeota bacterium]